MKDTDPPPKDVPAFGRKMKAERERRNYTQDDLAEMLQCSRATIAMVENGHMFSFSKDAYYGRLADMLGGTGEEWKALADRSKLSFLLSGAGDGITEEHRRTGEMLARHWSTLSPAAVRAIRQAIVHELGRQSQPTKLPKAA
jgi:transcriptional regulator with XRE-family HTH domain